MGRRSSRRPIVPEARRALDQLKADVMRAQGYQVNPDEPDKVKYEVARSVGVPLEKGYNGNLTTESAGKVGGQIGGSMVREMIRIAQESLQNNKQR
jgi:small acid-soluble spore protein D (minor alpha/beta-type SASP)